VKEHKRGTSKQTCEAQLDQTKSRCYRNQLKLSGIIET